MKNYNIQNYIRYKEDVSDSISRLDGKMWDVKDKLKLVITGRVVVLTSIRLKKH